MQTYSPTLTRQNDADISVIIPTYNNGAFVGEALRSVFAQTLRPKEIIVVDDGSTDDTREQVARFESQLIRYEYQQNAGVSRARNHGIDISTGEFLAFLDADDLWRPRMLEEHFNLHTFHGSLAFTFSDFERFEDKTRKSLGTQFIYYNELSTTKTVSLLDENRLISEDPFCALVAFGEFPAYTSAMMFSRRLIGDLRFDGSLRVCEDAHFVLRASMSGAVGYIDAVLTDVRRHDTNATVNFSTIANDKLTALVKLQPFVADSVRRQALSERLCRAHFSVARLHMRLRNYELAFEHWRRAIEQPATWQRKAKSSAGLLLSVLDRQPGANEILHGPGDTPLGSTHS